MEGVSYHCDTCGERHEDLPDVGARYPDPYLDVPAAERAARTALTPDSCIVRDEDGEHYFVRGVILLAIVGSAEALGIGAWVSQSRQNFERYVANEAKEPTMGWLVTRIRHYPETTYLLTARLHFGDGVVRPTIELLPSAHPLAQEQHEGISLRHAWEIVHHCMDHAPS